MVVVAAAAASADVMTPTATVVEVVVAAAAAAVVTTAVTTVRVVAVATERTVATTVATVTIVEAAAMTAATTDVNVTTPTVAALTDTPDATIVRVVDATQVVVVARSVVPLATNVIVATSELTVRVVLDPVIPLRPATARLDPDLKEAAKPTEVRPNRNKHFDTGHTSTANAPSRELSVRDGYILSSFCDLTWFGFRAFHLVPHLVFLLGMRIRRIPEKVATHKEFLTAGRMD